jgi:hypothetical protein
MSQVAPLTLLSAIEILDSSLEGWTLLEPTPAASRTYRQEVTFVRPFSVPPIVQVGIVGLDVSNADNIRVRVRAVDILPTGFALQAETWLNTRIWSVELSWLAIGG